MPDYTPTVSEEVRRGLDSPPPSAAPPPAPAAIGQVKTFVRAQEGDLQYCLETGIVHVPDPVKQGEFREDPRKFSFQRAYVVNPWGATPDEQFQWKNVFDTPTQATALRIARRVEALLPTCKCTLEREANFAIYSHSQTPWAVVATEQGYPRLRLMAGRHALHIMRLGWNAWKGELKMLVDEVCPMVPVATGAEEPRDW
jgi:hypothetical protein